MLDNKCLAVRNRRGFSQQKLAVLAGVSPATIVAIEKYGYVPGPWVRRKLARALRASEAGIWPELCRKPEANKQWK